jgi:hypothetical protein
MSADPRRRCAFECDPRRPAFLHCQLLFVQVVGHGYDKKKDHNGTRHRDDLLPVTRLSRREPCRARKFCPQQHKAQQRHAYPHEIECQLHGHGVWYAFHCAGATFFRTRRHPEQSSAKDSELEGCTERCRRENCELQRPRVADWSAYFTWAVARTSAPAMARFRLEALAAARAC